MGQQLHYHLNKQINIRLKIVLTLLDKRTQNGHLVYGTTIFNFQCHYENTSNVLLNIYDDKSLKYVFVQ